MSAPKISLIINTFNQPDYLGRVLAAISRQTHLPHEVKLADDGSGEETRGVFDRWAASQTFSCKHLWQENQGFRRCRILNQAIADSKGDYVVFLDGDTVPHWRFIADHQSLARKACFVQGHRALVQQQASEYFGMGDFAADRKKAFLSGQINGWGNAFRWPMAFRRVRADLRGIRGCNLGVWRADLVRVNGYNEDFKGWGREDSELAARLMNSGVRRRDARGWAICWHLWHPPASRTGLVANEGLLAAAIQESHKRCEMGLSQYLPRPST